MSYVVFDLETELSDGPLDLDRHVPAITVAAMLSGDGDLRLRYEQGEGGQATGDALSQWNAEALVRYLADMAQAGHMPVTWNGTGFDFRVLAHASGLVDACVDLAWGHVDMMFWFHCLNGFSVGLASAARAVGSGKTRGLSGADAPRLWAAGQYERLLEYAAQDVRALAAVYQAAVQDNGLRWIDSRGRLSRAPGPLLPVREAFELPLPDTSWMRRRPWPREKFVGWMLNAERI